MSLSAILDAVSLEFQIVEFKFGGLGEIFPYFLSYWKEYDRGDSFPFDHESNGIQFGS